MGCTGHVETLRSAATRSGSGSASIVRHRVGSRGPDGHARHVALPRPGRTRPRHATIRRGTALPAERRQPTGSSAEPKSTAPTPRPGNPSPRTPSTARCRPCRHRGRSAARRASRGAGTCAATTGRPVPYRARSRPAHGPPDRSSPTSPETRAHADPGALRMVDGRTATAHRMLPGHISKEQPSFGTKRRMEWSGARVLVAGATGVIGQGLTAGLSGRGASLARAGQDEHRPARAADRHGSVPRRSFDARPRVRRWPVRTVTTAAMGGACPGCAPPRCA
jgi:hypothetical protein